MTAADLDLEALREVVDAGSPRPWHVTEYDRTSEVCYTAPDDHDLFPGEPVAVGIEMTDADAALIVAAVNALPVLIEAVQRLSGEVNHWQSHAEDAGAGFTQVCKDAARISARNVELVREMDALTADRDRLRERVAELNEALKMEAQNGATAECDRDTAEAEVARLTAVVQGALARLEDARDYSCKNEWDQSQRDSMIDEVVAVLAGGTDTPKGEGE